MSDIEANQPAAGKSEPSLTDLNYYSQPENYAGSNFQTLRRFRATKAVEGSGDKEHDKKSPVKDAKYDFFHRYKHILRDVSMDYEPDDDDDDSDEGHVKSRHGGDSETDSRRKKLSHESADSGHPSSDPSAISPSESRIGDLGKRRSTGTAGLLALAIQKSKLDNIMMNYKARSELRDKFISVAKGIKGICCLYAVVKGNAEAIARNAKLDSTNMSFIDMATQGPSFEENMKNAGLFFDPNYYKAKREISLSLETRTILTKPPKHRTPEQVQTAMFGLQCLPSYAEYPLHIQEKLARVAWYEVVEPKRVIIRQGHYAENFYFILSGQLIVTILAKNPTTGQPFAKTATVLKKGMSFGELALLHRTRRTATVSTVDQVQLLTIGRADFLNIFMSSESEDNIPEHIRFISNLDFMKDWPLEELLENPDHCLMHFFRRNTTIVQDSTKSKWIYVIKSGSCQVLKKLHNVTGSNTFYAKPKNVLDETEVTLSPERLHEIAKQHDPEVSKQTINQIHSRPGTARRTGTAESSQDDQDMTFSKEHYIRNPNTKRAHFKRRAKSAGPNRDSSFARRKKYQPPPECVPPRPQEPSVKRQIPEDEEEEEVFVQVSNMKPRDVFGLQFLEIDEGVDRTYPEVSLVSRGAECVMLNKEFYMKYANAMVKRRLRTTVPPYPTDDIFQENLQIKANWHLYKNHVIHDVMDQLHETPSH